MKHAFFRPALLSAAICMALPLTLSAQTAGTSSSASPPMTGATGAPAGVGGGTAPSPHGNAATQSGNASSTSGAAGSSGASGASAASVPAASGAAASGDTSHKAAGKAGQAALSKADRDFMHKAAGAGMYEVEVSRLATANAKNPGVKEFAEKMVSDHSAANKELTEMAQSRGVELPQKIPADKQKVIDRLRNSKNFDADYLQTVGLKDHKADIALFEKASRTAKDSELKKWASEKLPTLRAHLAQAQTLHADARAGRSSQAMSGGSHGGSANSGSNSGMQSGGAAGAGSASGSAPPASGSNR